MSLTPNIFSSIGTFFSENLFGSIVLSALFIIVILVVLVLAARISFKIGLVIIFPAILALLGIGVSKGLLGVNYRWIGVMVIIAIALGAFALIWHKMVE